MSKSPRLLFALAAGAFLLVGTGCHYDYGYYNVGYSYGYDCSPRYHSDYSCDYSYSSHYHAPCDGLRFRTGYTVGYSGHHHRRGLHH